MKQPQESSTSTRKHPHSAALNETQLELNHPNKIKIERIFLKDQQGMVQIFIASNRLLQLDQLQALLQRQLQPSHQQRLCVEQAENELLAGSGKVINMLTVVDQPLLSCCPLYMYHDAQGQYVQMIADYPWQQDMLTQEAEISLPLQESISADVQVGMQQDRQALEQAVTNFTALRMQQRLQETLEIPPLPHTAQAVIQLRSNPDADVSQLSKIIESDPSLAAQVVSWASSSYYAAPGKIKSVQDAIVRVLGYDLVMNLALGLALGKHIELPKQTANGVTPYWQQAVYMAAAMGSLISMISREIRPSFGLSYLSGLLHNFGYLILAYTFKPQFITNNQAIAFNPHLESYQVEQALIGICQEQMAACLMDAWQMPAQIYTAVRYQHDPLFRGEHFEYALLLYICRQMLRQVGLISGPCRVIDEKWYAEIGLDPAECLQVFDNLVDSREQLDAIVSVMSGK